MCLNDQYERMQIEYIFQKEIDIHDPILRKLYEYCEHMNILFTTRVFDSITYDHDRECIMKLPAIHIYNKNQYHETYYPDEQPVQKIRLLYAKFELEEMEYLAKKQIWDERLKYIKRLFRKRSLKTDSPSTKNTI
jgi:hypothetical protein